MIEDARKLGRFRDDAAQSRFLAAYDTAIEYWPTPPSQQDVDTRFGITHVLVSGPSSGSPIVLLHAIAVSSPAWYADIAAFADAHPVYAIDTITDPGRSRQSAPVRSGDDYAAWLTEVLAALGWTGSISSDCRMEAGWHSTRHIVHPMVLVSVTAVDPVGAIGRGQATFFVKIVPDSLLALAKSEKAIHRLLRRLNNGTVPSQPLLDLSVAGLLTFRAKQPFPKRQSNAELGRVDLPTLLFFCGHSPVNRADRAAERSRRCIPNVDVEVVADAGHMLPVEHPTPFTARVLRFVEGIDATFDNGSSDTSK